MGKAAAAIATAAAASAALALFGPGVAADRSPLLGAELAPWNNALQHEAAQVALQQENLPLALRFARRAVAAMPLEQFGLTVAALAGGDPNRQLEALNLSAAMGWRDYVTNVRLVEAGMREGVPQVTAQRIDALGRTQGADVAGPLADALLTKPGGAEALAERAELRTALSWWDQYLQQSPQDPAVFARRANLIRRFDRQDGAWVRQMVGSAQQGFLRSGEVGAFLNLWRDTLAEPEGFDGLIYDPDFSRFVPGRPSLGQEWAVPGEASAVVERAESGGVIISQGSPVSGYTLNQTVALKPGPIALSASGSIDQGTAANFEWSLACASGRPIGLTGSEGALGRWTGTVPSDCDVGILGLRTLGRAGAGAQRLSLREVRLEGSQ